jgi:hypothetical protein
MEGDEERESNIRYRFQVNLNEPFEKAPFQWLDSTAPRTMGLILGFMDELAQFDRQTVPRVVKTYFYHCLGEDEQDAFENYELLCSAWGNLCKGDFGNRVSHLFLSIDIALMTQTRLCPIIVAGNFAGSLLSGAGFHLSVFGARYRPFSVEEVVRGLQAVDEHSNALWKIFGKLSFATQADREVAYKGCRSTRKLKEYCDALPLTGANAARDEVLKLAKKLSFDTDRPFPITAKNIETVLSYIEDHNKDLSLLPYLHPSLLFSTKRAHIAWSAFGHSAPSFRVPGGKAMNLTAPFRVAITQKGVAGHRDVTKIAANTVPLELALRHLDDVFQDKNVWNPYGNQSVQTSTANIHKVFVDDSCSMIVASFRKALHINVVSEAGQNDRKRKGEPMDGPKTKKGALAL